MKRPLGPGSVERPVDPLANGFSDTWRSLHPCLKSALAYFDFPLGDYADARTLADKTLVDDAVHKEILDKAISLLPPEGRGQDRPDILEQQFYKLMRLAEKVPALADCRFHGLYLDAAPPPVGPVELLGPRTYQASSSFR